MLGWVSSYVGEPVTLCPSLPRKRKKALAGEPGRAASTRWHVALLHVTAYGTLQQRSKVVLMPADKRGLIISDYTPC